MCSSTCTYLLPFYSSQSAFQSCITYVVILLIWALRGIHFGFQLLLSVFSLCRIPFNYLEMTKAVLVDIRLPATSLADPFAGLCFCRGTMHRRSMCLRLRITKRIENLPTLIIFTMRTHFVPRHLPVGLAHVLKLHNSLDNVLHFNSH